MRMIFKNVSLAALICSLATAGLAQMTPAVPPTPVGTIEVPRVVRTPGAISVQPVAPSGSAMAANAALKFEPAMVDFGAREEGEQVEIIFPMKNTSDKKITVSNIETGCGCTTTSQKNFEVEPGATAEIKLNYNTNGHPGAVSRSVRVTTDDPAQTVYAVTFKGEVKQSAWLMPPFLEIGNLEESMSASKEFSLIYTKPEPLEIKGAKISNPLLTVEQVTKRPYEKGTQKGEEFVFRVTAPETLAAGDVNGMIEFQTDSKTHLPTMNVRATVQGPIQTTPSRFSANIGLNEETSRTLQLSSRNGKPFTIKEVVPDPNLPGKFEVKDGPTPQTKLIVGTVTGIDKPSTIQGRVHAKVMLEGEDKVRDVAIPFFMTVGRRRAVPPSGQPVTSQQTGASGANAVMNPIPAKKATQNMGLMVPRETAYH